MAMDHKSFKVVAYAGAGKTTTLKLIGERLRGRGLYLAFNKAIANDARAKFPGHVDCRTFHSLAYRHVPRDITAKLSLPRFSPKRLGDDLGLQPVQVRRQIEGSNKYITLTPARLARFVSDAVSHFCSTHASYPAPRHLLFPSWLDHAVSTHHSINTTRISVAFNCIYRVEQGRTGEGWPKLAGLYFLLGPTLPTLPTFAHLHQP